jgi:hypothetical protein
MQYTKVPTPPLHRQISVQHGFCRGIPLKKSIAYATASKIPITAIPVQLIADSGRSTVCKIPATKIKNGPGKNGSTAPNNPNTKRLIVKDHTPQNDQSMPAKNPATTSHH